MYDGLREADIIWWLLGPWRDDGPAVCVVEGFSGIGKTLVAQKVTRKWPSPAVIVTATEDSDLETLLFTIAAKLETAGYSAVADHPGDFRDGLLEFLTTDALVVIDDFETLLSPDTHLPSREILTFISELGRQPRTGRLLIVTGQSPATGSWLENAVIKRMAPPANDEAERLLWTLLQDRGLLKEVPHERFPDIVTWLGRNPRAMQAFAECLRDEQLDVLINLDAEAWDLREQGATPQMVARLESVFLRKTISRLNPAASILLEFLSVYRRRFTCEVIDAAPLAGVRPSTARESLTSRFLLNRRGNQYELNPIARQLGLARLSQEPRRKLAAHSVAADHYARRVHPKSEQSRVRSGADFVEARYHLLQAGREAEFQRLAGDYRQLLRKSYRTLEDVPQHEGVAAQLLPSLMAALYDVNGGYAHLRAILAKLLDQRGLPGDSNLAYQQVTIATREARDGESWRLRVQLASQLEKPRTVLTIADQALRLLDHRTAAPVVRTAADRLADQRQPALALDVISHGLASLPVEFCLELYPVGAFLLARQGRHLEAIDLLLAGRSAAGHDVLNSDQLLEQAAFLAFGKRDLARLAEIKAAMIKHGCDRKLKVLCEVLECQLRGQYKAAATLAGSHRDYYPIAAQGAFCWLAEAQRDQAAKILETVRFRRSRASSWLEGVLAGSYGAWEVYGQAMSDASTRQLTETDTQARDLWVRVWEEDTRIWPGTYPAFCFPRLPAGLTGLPVDLEHRAYGVSATAEYPGHDFSLDAIGNVSHHAWHDLPEAASEAAGQPAPPGSTFNVYGNIAVGQNASVHRSYFCGIMLPAGTTREDLIADLEVLLGGISHNMAADEVEPAAAGLREAIAAARQDDQPRLIAGLKAAGKWALDQAAEVGTLIAATALQHALGIS